MTMTKKKIREIDYRSMSITRAYTSITPQSESQITLRNYKFESLHIQKINNLVADNPLQKWLEIVESLEFKQDLSRPDLKEFSLTQALQDAFQKSISYEWKNVVDQIEEAMNDYVEIFPENKTVKPLSPDSIKYILHLVPIFSTHKPSVSIDADTGYFTAIFKSAHDGLMTVFITNKDELHFSLAERGRKLVKITGTAKIKDPHDLKKFSKVLSML